MVGTTPSTEVNEVLKGKVVVLATNAPEAERIAERLCSCGAQVAHVYDAVEAATVPDAVLLIPESHVTTDLWDWQRYINDIYPKVPVVRLHLPDTHSISAYGHDLPCLPEDDLVLARLIHSAA